MKYKLWVSSEYSVKRAGDLIIASGVGLFDNNWSAPSGPQKLNLHRFETLLAKKLPINEVIN